jgi:hypothetical protein
LAKAPLREKVISDFKGGLKNAHAAASPHDIQSMVEKVEAEFNQHMHALEEMRTLPSSLRRFIYRTTCVWLLCCPLGTKTAVPH